MRCRSLSARADRCRLVLVHDAARPCVTRKDIDRLISTCCMATMLAGFSGCPVHDTMKRTDAADHRRDSLHGLFLARLLRHQMFRFGLLFDAPRPR